MSSLSWLRGHYYSLKQELSPTELKFKSIFRLISFKAAWNKSKKKTHFILSDRSV
jgi:hypothetical protein